MLPAISSFLAISCAAALLTACGGGSSAPAPTGGPAPEAPPVAVIDPLAPVAPVDLSAAIASLSVGEGGVGGDSAGDAGVGGAAGDGAALRRATIVLTDIAGKTLTGQTDDAGNYLIRYKSTEFKPPFVMKVIDAGGNVLAAPSEATVPAGKVARININPLTDKITSDILPASVAGTDKQFTGASLNLAGLPQAKANLLMSIRAALSTAGVTNTTAFDPVTSKYAYDGTGVDAVIESISLARNPATGATQLQAKLAGLATAADGVVTPTLISASTPLATTQVAIASSPALTFGKLEAWINYVNSCLAVTRPAGLDCSDAVNAKVISPNYKHSSRDFDEDFRSLMSETDRQGVRGSQLRNANILFTARSAGSAVDDVVAVEVTISQPRTGPLAGNLTTPIQYTKFLTFRRDDVTPGLIAGNWILHGNQRNYNWFVEPRYATLLQQNSIRDVDDGTGLASRTTSSIRMNFSPQVFNPTTRTVDAPSVYAVRLKGPGLPAAGVVFAPTTGNTGGILGVLNKTGTIPPQGSTTAFVQADFRFAQALNPSGLSRSDTTWPRNFPYYAETPTSTDFSKLQAFSAYTAEIYVNGSTQPIIETARTAAAVEVPANYVQRPLHDLTPSLALIKPPRIASTSNVVLWVRNPLAGNITSAFTYFETAVNTPGFSSGANLQDAFSVNPNSTSITIPVAQGTMPAFTADRGNGAREVGLTGSTSRVSFQQTIYWSN